MGAACEADGPGRFVPVAPILMAVDPGFAIRAAVAACALGKIPQNDAAGGGGGGGADPDEPKVQTGSVMLEVF